MIFASGEKERTVTGMDEYIKRDDALMAISYYPIENPEPGDIIQDVLETARKAIAKINAADVAPVRHSRCDVCSGKAVLTQDTDNGYSLEINSEQKEASLWYGDNCLAVFRIDFCPACGARMDGVHDG